MDLFHLYTPTTTTTTPPPPEGCLVGKICNLSHNECFYFSLGVTVNNLFSTGLFVHPTGFLHQVAGTKMGCCVLVGHSAGYFSGNRTIATLKFISLSPAIQKNLYSLHVNKQLLFMPLTCLFLLCTSFCVTTSIGNSSHTVVWG